MTGRKSKSLAVRSKPQREWLVLLDTGLRSVRRIMLAGPAQPGKQRVREALNKIGLLNFLRTVWKWQTGDICSQFVTNWNKDEKTTSVNNIEIDVSIQTFVMVTGLLAEESAMASKEAEHGDISETSAEKMWKRGDDSSSYPLSEVEVPWFRDLIDLLSTTVWMSFYNPEHVPVDLVDSVSEALSGRRLRWSESLHSKFVCEVTRLHSQSRQKYNANGSLRVVQAVGGPVMCFLYVQAKIKAEALAELRGPFPGGRGETLKESNEYHEEESLPGQDVARSEVTDEEHSKQDQVLSVPEDTSISHSDYPSKKSKSRKLPNQKNKSSVSLPASSSVTEDLEAKVLELECVIARQNAELAESRLRLYKKGSLT